MNRGFVGVLIMIAVVAGIVGGIGWWALRQSPSTPSVPNTTQGEAIPTIFTYSARNNDFPLGLFQLTGGVRVLGANYVRVRNTSTAVYTLLGKSAGTPLAASCHWVVNASIEITNPKLDTSSYSDLSPIPTVAVADLVRVVSHSQPQQVCAP